MKLPSSDDTIVAISTPPGYGGIGIVRISGNQAFSLASHLVEGDINLQSKPSHTIHYGFIREMADATIIDEVLLSVFRAPNSYTGEDVVEISAHGNPRLLWKIVQRAIEAGCRHATAGEFTLRAFQSGRIDLVQAEAVADLIAAEGTAAQQAALYQLTGKLSGFIDSLRKQLIEIAALFEAYTDFPDEEIPQEEATQLKERLKEVREHLHRLADSYRRGRLLRSGVQIPIVGPPNAGKSSLFNAILAEERAIVTEVPGTTRDTISEKIEIRGLILRLIDTAGIRDTSDQIEAIGVHRSQREIAAASLIIAILDAVTAHKETVRQLIDLLGNKRFLLVFNKCDLITERRREQLEQAYTDLAPLFVSARNLFNIDHLLQRLHDTVTSGLPDGTDSNTLTNQRHFVAVTQALEALDTVIEQFVEGGSFELLAFDLRQAIEALEEVLGKITNDDLLAEIFSRFCIGK